VALPLGFYSSVVSSFEVRVGAFSFLRILAYENSSCLTGLPLKKFRAILAMLITSS
jgi:hypothetical protein